MAGTSIAGSIIKSKAAKKAAKTQVAGATDVAERARETSGSVAGDVRGAGTTAAADVRGAGATAAERSLAAGEAAASGVEGATTEANLLLKDIHGRSTGLTEPYREAGGGAISYLSDLLAPEGEFNQRFSMADYEADPGYAFRLEEGRKALERSAAGRGALQSGSTLKALTKYSQGVASQEYQNAFDRFMEQRKTRYGMLSDVAGFGERGVDRQLAVEDIYGGRASANLTRGAEVAGGFRVGGAGEAGRFDLGSAESAGRFDLGSAESAGGFRMGGERIAGEAMMGAANARAAGQVGSANAWSSGIQGAGQNVAQYMMLRDLIKAKPRPVVV